jgi:hypothetical protein
MLVNCHLSLVAVDQQRSERGSNHPDYLYSLQYLADFYNMLNRYADSEPLLVECLERRKNVLGDKNPDTIQSLDTLANLYDVQGLCRIGLSVLLLCCCEVFAPDFDVFLCLMYLVVLPFF